MFTMQHYTALAKVIRQTRLDISSGKGSMTVAQIHDKLEAVGQLQMNLIGMLKKDNPKFQEFTFIGACSEHTPTNPGRR